MRISPDINKNIDVFKKRLHCDLNFDIVFRSITICGRTAAMFFVDGFAKDDIIEKLMEFFYSNVEPDQLADAHTFSKACVPYCEVTLREEEEEIATGILSGELALFVDGFDRCVAIDTRTYPQRENAEPEKDRAFRGSKDAFVETLILNTALIRRRIRDPQLCMENMTVGTKSKTDLSLCYLDDKVDKKLLTNIKNRISASQVEALTMNQQSLADLLVKKKWYNPFPKFKYSERPDVCAAQILEGDIVILVDNAPYAMILPSALFDITDEVNDYYFPPITGTYLRLTRFLVTLATLLITPLWLMFLMTPQWIPDWLSFIVPKEEPHIPIIAQLLILEIAIDGLKLASLSTPSMLTTSLSVISAIVVGDFAVESGWFSAETMLYMALVAIATYTQPNFELGYAIKFMRMFLLLATWLFGAWGFFIGLIVIFLVMVSNRTVSGGCYLYPLIPLHPRDLMRKFFRVRLKSKSER